MNGAAAHLVNPGDKVIIMSYLLAQDAELADHTPRVVHVDDDNRMSCSARIRRSRFPATTVR